MNSKTQQPTITISGDWLSAFKATQEQTAHAHAVYQQAMSNAHVAYLQAAQTGFASLAALAGQPMPASLGNHGHQTFQAAPIVAPPSITIQSPPPQIMTPQPVVTPQVIVPPAVVEAAPVAAIAPAVAPLSQPKPTMAPQPVAETGPDLADLSTLLLGVVSEKTGYPPEMLSMEMTLEGDLGIDSIKRVEILSAVQEKAPSLPEVDAGAMAFL
jgi:hypothetical protein